MTEQIDHFLNAIIAKFHSDTAVIRRYMIENGVLEMDDESVYLVSENWFKKSPDLGSWIQTLSASIATTVSYKP